MLLRDVLRHCPRPKAEFDCDPRDITRTSEEIESTLPKALLREIPAPAKPRKDWIDGMECRRRDRERWRRPSG